MKYPKCNTKEISYASVSSIQSYQQPQICQFMSAYHDSRRQIKGKKPKRVLRMILDLTYDIRRQKVKFLKRNQEKKKKRKKERKKKKALGATSSRRKWRYIEESLVDLSL